MDQTALENRIRELELEILALKSENMPASKYRNRLNTDLNSEYREVLEEKLNESDKKLQQVITTTSEGFWLMDETGRFLEVNPAFSNLVGYSEKELLSMGIPDIEALESKQETDLHIRKVLKMGNDRFETVMRRKDRSLVNVEVNVSRFGLSKNRFFAFIHDISERKHAEEDLKRSELLLKKLNSFALELSNPGIDENLEQLITRKAKELAVAEVSIFSEYNSDNRTTTTRNIELESGMLKKVVDLLGKRIQNVHSPVSDAMYTEMTHDLIGTRKNLHDASFGAVSKPVGSAIDKLLNVDRYIGIAYVIEGKLYGTSLLGMRRDQPTPPREIIENFIHLAASSLQQNKIEKQLKIKIEELTNSNKKLELFAHANEELEQFAFIASHNLQQPLRTVSNYIQIFEEDYTSMFDERATNYLGVVKSSVTRMITLLNSLLDFSRLGRNLSLTKVNCKKMIDNVLTDLEILRVSSGAVIEVSMMPEIYLYESEFSQLLSNLIINGIKFQKEGNTPQIMISCDKISTGWKFSVKDNGIGIEEKYFSRIFDIFQRLHTDSEYKGSGIGLAFCKKIIQLHKGNIWVESNFGHGTTFFFTVGNLPA